MIGGRVAGGRSRRSASVYQQTGFNFGTEVVDISPYGMRIRADVIAEVGDEVILSFKAPGGREWFDAEARVTRILWGNREEDDGAELVSSSRRYRLRRGSAFATFVEFLSSAPETSSRP